MVLKPFEKTILGNELGSRWENRRRDFAFIYPLINNIGAFFKNFGDFCYRQKFYHFILTVYNLKEFYTVVKSFLILFCFFYSVGIFSEFDKAI